MRLYLLVLGATGFCGASLFLKLFVFTWSKSPQIALSLIAVLIAIIGLGYGFNKLIQRLRKS